jgi:hypothetical protein
MYFDRSYTLKGAGAGLMLISPEGDILKYVIKGPEKVTKGGRVNGSQ